MPNCFRIGSYCVYFWLNEGRPPEPIHVHIADGKPTVNATKVWILKNGTCLLEHNNSKIPSKKLNDMLEIIENNSAYIIADWKARFGTISYKK